MDAINIIEKLSIILMCNGIAIYLGYMMFADIAARKKLAKAYDQLVGPMMKSQQKGNNLTLLDPNKK